MEPCGSGSEELVHFAQGHARLLAKQAHRRRELMLGVVLANEVDHGPMLLGDFRDAFALGEKGGHLRVPFTRREHEPVVIERDVKFFGHGTSRDERKPPRNSDQGLCRPTARISTAIRFGFGLGGNGARLLGQERRQGAIERDRDHSQQLELAERDAAVLQGRVRARVDHEALHFRRSEREAVERLADFVEGGSGGGQGNLEKVKLKDLCLAKKSVNKNPVLCLFN